MKKTGLQWYVLILGIIGIAGLTAMMIGCVTSAENRHQAMQIEKLKSFTKAHYSTSEAKQIQSVLYQAEKQGALKKSKALLGVSGYLAIMSAMIAFTAFAVSMYFFEPPEEDTKTEVKAQIKVEIL